MQGDFRGLMQGKNMSHEAESPVLITFRTDVAVYSVFCRLGSDWICFFNTYLLTYSMEQSPSWEANWFAASQEIPPIYGTRKFITVLTIARNLSLSWARSIQSPNPLPLPENPS
jgi:hypothetical protein